MKTKIINAELLDGVAVFVAVVNSGSFKVAAESLRHSTSYVSKEVTRLEKRLGSRLLNRTTRTISLTDAGKAYYERCQQIVIDAENASRSVSSLQEEPRGLLRVNAPISFGSRFLLDHFSKFLHRYPEVNLEIEFNDRKIDVVAEGYDVVIRVGNVKDSNLVARAFAQSKSVIVASPDYLHRHGTPMTASALAQHHCIAYSLAPNPLLWELRKGDENLQVKLAARAQCNNAELMVALACDGIGIANMPLFTCEKELAEGKLTIILDDYEQPEYGVFAVYPHRQYLTAKVRVFVDYLVESFGESGLPQKQPTK
ncbi:LysR family transcriptional regulator [Halioxenophilus sp. WMMB6]|uniref:LysR family transcriptional regulator n=1 Tax=Halioxenophilus sp. WMMB6 TaxID=3073815 RepID=UPI00295E2E6B|nr:LysR substrate-binding domain-containing protein [Halioxenophilus sp. WMMB6]